MRIGVDAGIDHHRDQRRHLTTRTDQIARGAAARDERRRAHAVRPRIAVAPGRAGAFPVSTRWSGNKIVRRNAGGGTPLARFPAADDRLRDVVTTLHAHILPPLWRCLISRR
jgi:hypothetical protein